jgi:hypothetical protein
VLAHIEKGRAAPNAPDDHELTVFAFLCVGDEARAKSRAVVEGQAAWLGIPPADVHVVGGSAETAAEHVRALWAAGARTVVLRPIGGDPLGQVRAVLGALGPAR